MKMMAEPHCVWLAIYLLSLLVGAALWVRQVRLVPLFLAFRRTFPSRLDSWRLFLRFELVCWW